MSTTRHRRRTWQQIGYRAAAGVLLAADAAWTIHAHNGAAFLATLALGVSGAAFILTACSWLASTAWHRGRGRYLAQTVATTPLRRPLYPIGSYHQREPYNDNPFRDAINAGHQRRHDGPAEWDSITGSRPYLPPVSATAAADGPAR